MTVSNATGTKFYIGPAITSATDTLAEFQALSPWVEVGEFRSMGPYGDASADVPSQSLSSARTGHTKGVRDAGTTDVIVYNDPADAGQIAMRAAERENSVQYAFKVVHSDKVTVSGEGSTDYFRGRVMSARRNGAQPDTNAERTFQIGINSEIFEVDAT